MAGLIQQNMQQRPGASAEDESNEMEPVEGPGMDGSPGHEAAEGEAPEPAEMGANNGSNGEQDATYVAALKLAMTALYKNDAAKHVADALSKSQDKVEAMANTAYEMTSIVDERTEGKVPDSLFALLAMRILNEVADIAIAAQVDIQPADIAAALKTMILRYLGERGHDVAQLQQAMDKVDLNEFNKMAQEQGAPA